MFLTTPCVSIKSRATHEWETDAFVVSTRVNRWEDAKGRRRRADSSMGEGWQDGLSTFLAESVNWPRNSTTGTHATPCVNLKHRSGTKIPQTVQDKPFNAGVTVVHSLFVSLPIILRGALHKLHAAHLLRNCGILNYYIFIRLCVFYLSFLKHSILYHDPFYWTHLINFTLAQAFV